MGKQKKIAVFISGRGSNMEALVRNCADDDTIDFRLVFSNKRNAKGLETAKGLGVETLSFERKEFESKEAYHNKLIEELKVRNIDIICLAGYMAIVAPSLIAAFPSRILNIHPSLLPAFPGLNVQQRAIDRGVKFSGCTVHLVDEGVDTGPILLQRVVPVFKNDTADTLAERILIEEHQVYSEALRLLTHGSLI